MKIRMRIDVSGTRTGEWEPGAFSTREWPRRGSVVELPDAEAAEYCERGMAEPVAVFGRAETAVVKAPVQERTAAPEPAAEPAPEPAAEPAPEPEQRPAAADGPGLRTDTESGAAVRRGPGRPRKNPVSNPISNPVP